MLKEQVCENGEEGWIMDIGVDLYIRPAVYKVGHILVWSSTAVCPVLLLNTTRICFPG